MTDIYDGFYLFDHPNPNGDKFYRSRNGGLGAIKFVVIHTAENTPDTIGPDSGAENVANYAATTTRSASWHVTVDSDSIIPMLPDVALAWHAGVSGRSYNTPSLGIEQATKAAMWPQTPDDWDYEMVLNCATVVRAWCDRYNIPKRRVSKADIDAGRYGIVAHGDLDPANRSDPGASYPWDLLIRLVNEGTEELTVGQYEDIKADIQASEDRVKRVIWNQMAAQNKQHGKTRSVIWSAASRLVNILEALTGLRIEGRDEHRADPPPEIE